MSDQSPPAKMGNGVEKHTPSTLPTGTKPVPTDTTDAVVRINVGGTVFTTTAGTLRWAGPTCVLHRLADVALTAPENMNPPLLDRDPDAFGHVLRFLRAARFRGEVLPNSSAAREALLVEADALKLPQLRTALLAAQTRTINRVIVMAEKSTLCVAGTAVSGHYTIAGRRGATGWFSGFSPEGLERAFQRGIGTAISDAAKSGLVLIQTSSAAAATQEDFDPKSEIPRIRHVVTITLTFGHNDL